MSNTPVLKYHHPDDQRFSLQHVTGDEVRHQERAEDLRSRDDIDVRQVKETGTGDTVYLIYTNDAPDDALPDFETEAELLQWLRAEFEPDDLPVVLAVYRAYRGIVDEKADSGTDLDLYKQMHLERIPEVLDRVEWRQPVADVGAELLSAFILVHPMPNTNHRTGISLLDRYLTSVNSAFTMPETGEEREWYPWVVEYIHDSKRLLTLRRNLVLFRYAAKCGYQSVRRKEGISIDLTAVDVERPNAFQYYSDQHFERTRTFVEKLLDQAEATTLQEQIDDGQRAFVDRLRAGGSGAGGGSEPENQQDQ